MELFWVCVVEEVSWLWEWKNTWSGGCAQPPPLIVLLFSVSVHRESKSESCSVVSNSLWPCGPYSPWNSPGQDTGVDGLSLLQGIFPTQGLNPGFPHCRWILSSWATREAQEYWSAQPFPSSADLPNPGIKLGSPALQVAFYQPSYQGSPVLREAIPNCFSLGGPSISCLTASTQFLTFSGSVQTCYFWCLGGLHHRCCRSSPWLFSSASLVLLYGDIWGRF